MVERLFLTAMYMEYSRMRPDGVVGGSHVIWTESLACEKEKKSIVMKVKVLAGQNTEALSAI